MERPDGGPGKAALLGLWGSAISSWGGGRAGRCLVSGSGQERREAGGRRHPPSPDSGWVMLRPRIPRVRFCSKAPVHSAVLGGQPCLVREADELLHRRPCDEVPGVGAAGSRAPPGQEWTLRATGQAGRAPRACAEPGRLSGGRERGAMSRGKWRRGQRGAEDALRPQITQPIGTTTLSYVPRRGGHPGPTVLPECPHTLQGRVEPASVRGPCSKGGEPRSGWVVPDQETALRR